MNKKPLRVFEGTANPYEPFWRFRNSTETESGEPELEFYGYISEFSWWEDDITPKLFKDDLYKNGMGGPITIRMNSGGGEVFAASVIKSIIVEYPGRVTVRIDGLAASAATIVAMGGDVIKMQDSAYFMIHDPSAVAWGTIDEFKRVLKLLETIKEGIIDGYLGKTHLGPEKLAKMMTDETWMTAQEAYGYGFIDEVIVTSDKKMNFKNLAVMNALRHYQNVPDDLKSMLQAQDEPDQPVTTIAPEVLRLRDEAKILK